MLGPRTADLKAYQKNRAKRISRMMKEFEAAMKRRVVGVWIFLGHQNTEGLATREQNAYCRI